MFGPKWQLLSGGNIPVQSHTTIAHRTFRGAKEGERFKESRTRVMILQSLMAVGGVLAPSKGTRGVPRGLLESSWGSHESGRSYPCKGRITTKSRFQETSATKVGSFPGFHSGVDGEGPW